jgi:hypothetical protein
MEVSLVETQGLPPGCLVSVRVGSTRRQAPADPEKLKLVFPKGCSPKDLIKVDLLAPVGSAEMPFTADANLYPLQVPVNGALANLTLGFSEAPSEKINKPEKPSGVGINLNSIYANMDFSKDEKGGSFTPNTASRRHKIALEARTYLDKHQLLVFIHGLLQALIQKRPLDPWDFIIECATAAKKLGVLDPSGNGEAPPPPKSSKRSQDEEDDEAFYKQRLDADDLGQATPVITRPPSATQRQGEVEQEALMQKVAGALKNVGGSSPEYKHKASVGSWLVTRSHTANAPGKGLLLESRARLSSALVKAADDGRLHRLLAFAAAHRQIAPDLKSAAATDALAAAEASAKIKELRARTQAVLLQATRDGRLDEALASRGKAVRPADVEPTRDAVQKGLVEAQKKWQSRKHCEGCRIAGYAIEGSECVGEGLRRWKPCICARDAAGKGSWTPVNNRAGQYQIGHEEYVVGGLLRWAFRKGVERSFGSQADARKLPIVLQG